MNILIVNDDGPDAWGLRILRETAKAVWPNARILTVTPPLNLCGRGSGLTPRKAGEVFQEKRRGDDDDFVILQGRPVDCVFYAFENRAKFISKGSWDLVLSGINHGSNVGWDIMHSGTCWQAMLAATLFSVPAYSFSQDLQSLTPTSDDENASLFRNASSKIRDILMSLETVPGDCWNVNFPSTPEIEGEKSTFVAHHPNHVPVDLDLLPRAKDAVDTDADSLKQGFVTFSPVSLNVNKARF